MKNQDILVSIIVPIYGTEAYLPACIDSIRNQSYNNLQIILVDDQSPDNCPEFCDLYAKLDSRITVIHQENKGVSGARNTGIAHAQGDYLMFVDSDDELYPQAVEVLLQDACEYQADIVWAPKKANNSGRAKGKYTDNEVYTVFQDEEALILSLNGVHNTNAVWSKLFRTDFVSGMFFEEGKNINEDGFFMFQCYLKKAVLVRHDICLYQYNTRLGSCSRQAFSDKYLSMLYFCERKKALIAERYPQYMELAHNMEVRTNLQMLQLLCRTNDRQYRNIQQHCIQTVCELYSYHRPINEAHRKLAWMVKHRLYPLYKFAVRFKYYR